MDIKGFKTKDGTVYQYDYGALANKPQEEETPSQGSDGGYYTPGVTQPEKNKVQFDFTPSKSDMPAVAPVQVELPVGPDSGGNVAYDEAQTLTDEQKSQARENIGAQPAGNYLERTELPNAVNDALEQAKESGKFNGEPGKTPEKGVDYYTDTDKTEMVNAVLSALPTWNGGSY